MDSIDIQKEHYAANGFGLIFTIVQKSIRFAKMKKLALYQDMDYMGTYQVVEFHTFRIMNLSNMVSLLVLGEHKDEGIKTLMKFKVKGRISEKTEMYFVCLQFVGYEDKYKIRRKSDEQEERQMAEKAVAVVGEKKEDMPF